MVIRPRDLAGVWCCPEALLTGTAFGPSDGEPEKLGNLDVMVLAPGSLWRTHMIGERYAVDVKLPGVAPGDEAAAAQRLVAAGLECSWIIPVELPARSAEVVLLWPAASG